MTFDEYQKESKKTAVYKTLGHPAIYPALGLAGEAGEVLERVKKFARDDDLKLTDARRDEIEKELGDVIWYMAQLCTEFGISFDAVATKNLTKLKSRHKRGVIKGDGDNR